MTLFAKNKFKQQAIILLSAQIPKDLNKIQAFQDNIHKLIKLFGQYDMGQKIIVLGDHQLMNETLLSNTDWLLAYNSAYQQPIMTSLQRGISLTQDHIESTMIWPIDTKIPSSDTVFQMLIDQKKNLTKVIKVADRPYPMCIPKNRLQHLLSLQPTQSLDEAVNHNLIFTKP